MVMRKIDGLMSDVYKIFCECPNKKELYNKIANYYQEEPTIGYDALFIQELYLLLDGPLSSRVERANKVRADILNPYNIYCPRKYKSLLDEIDIDFSDKDIHWL